MVPVEGMLNASNSYSTGIPCKESINYMVPSFSVHVAAAAGVAMLKSIAKQGRPEKHLFWSPSQAKESGFGRSPVLLAGNEGPG